MAEPFTPDQAEQFDDDPGIQPYEAEDIPVDREVVTTPYDPPIKSLLADIRAKDLIVNPEFQRLSVWDRVRKSRLVESLLLNIPIPVIFLAEDQDGTRVVVDGQQRLRAIEEFESGTYRLNGLQVLSDLNGKRWVDLTPKQARVISNRTLRCIVISASSDPNLRFEVFERLNTGGVSLNDQELRNSVYRGPFNAFLDDLARSSQWLALVGRREPDNRLQHHEMILRFLSLWNGLEAYRPPLKGWLNDFMKQHRHASPQTLAQFRGAFDSATTAVGSVFTNGVPPFRRARRSETGEIEWDRTLNRPVFELQMLGLMDEDVELLRARGPEIVALFADLCATNPDFEDALSRATADRTRTRLRFAVWGEALDTIGIRNELRERVQAV